MTASEILQQVAEEVSGCTRCPLHFGRKNAVPGEGPADAEILLTGEGPGFYENEQGRPFVGPSGNFLDELLKLGGLNRSEVFIANVVKCRPPKNRDPEPGELSACGDYLERQIEAINPRIIITLGRFSMARFMPGAKISFVHGKPRWVNGRLIIPMFHPAAALHQPALKTDIMADFTHLPEFLEQARKSPAKPAKAAEIQAEYTAPPPPETPAPVDQIGLFDAPPAPDPDPESEPPKRDEDNHPDEGPVQLSLF